LRAFPTKTNLGRPEFPHPDDRSQQGGQRRPRLARAAEHILARSPAQVAFRYLGAARVAVLAYHSVVNEQLFHDQMAYLRRRMNPISLSELLEALEGRRPLPRAAALITFDDGDRTVADSAMPILRALGLPAVAFVIAGTLHEGLTWWREVKQLIGYGGSVSGMEGISASALVRRLKRVPNEERIAAIAELQQTATAPARLMPQLRLEELPELERAGIAISNHTMTHPCLPNCSAEIVGQEVREAHRVLTSALGHPPPAFAYPNGDHDARVRAIVAECGYRAGFLFDHRLASIPLRDPLRISRLRVDSTSSMDRFRIIISGLHPALHRLRGRR
jgi:peptidoglycan/xylan/chitin deacetylase (PgdA/CDA1 family)